MEQHSNSSFRSKDGAGNRTKLLVRDISESLGKLPPQAPDLEEAVLGAILLEKDAMINILEFLRPEHFYVEANRLIYEAILDLFKKGEPVDMRTVIVQLRKNGKLDLIDGNGAFRVAEITSKVSSAANIEYHAKIIVEFAIKRNIIEIASQMHHDAYEDTQDVFVLLDSLERGVFEISDKNLRKKHASINTLINEAVIELTHKRNHKDGLTGVPTGFSALDRTTSGWQKSDLVIIAARPGMGKALGLDEKLMTPKGWIRMGDVKEGTLLAGSDGKFYPVTGVYPQGKRQTYIVHFDDGSEVICDKDHLWLTETRADRKTKGGRGGTIKTLEEIMKKVMVGSRKNHSIKFHKPIEFSLNKTAINPYIMGMLLGDGGFTSATIKWSNPEKDLIRQMRKLLPPGYKLAIGNDDLNHSIVMTDGNKTTMSSLLGPLKGKRSEEKHIPEEYLYNSIENRIQLLRGLIDTDGHVTNKVCPWIEYCTTSKVMANQVIDLVRGLGGRASVIDKMGRYTKDGVQIETRTAYRIYIAFANGIVPVSSKKHLARYKPKNYSQKFIESVIPYDIQDVQCITVASPDHLFVTTGNTLTHNTAFIVTAARNAAVDFDIPVAIFSLEMSSIQLTNRLLAAEAEIDSEKLRRGDIGEHEGIQLVSKTNRLSSAPIFIDDTPALTILELRAKCRRMVAEHGVKLIILDYLQLMVGDSKGNREQEVGSISRALKGIAKELNLPVIALSQLSRGVETRGGDKRPHLSDLRDSGSIEQDADIVLFLYRPEYYKITVDEDGMPTQGMAEVIVAKHRNGSLETVKLRFIMKFTKFLDYDNGPPSEYKGPLTRLGTDQSEYKKQHYKDPTTKLPSEDFDEGTPF